MLSSPPGQKESEARVRVLVTGANGFVGRHVILDLLGLGHEVVGVIRDTSREINIPGATWHVVQDFTDVRAWTAALTGIDAVVHAAARVHVMKPSPSDNDLFMRVNVDGTLTLARIAQSLGVGSFVFLSSIKVLGEQTFDVPFDVTDIPRPCDPYAMSKLAAENGLRTELAGSCTNLCIIRPPLVYGPYVGGNFLRMLALAATKLPLPVGGFHNKRSLVSVWNLSSLIARAVQVPRQGCGVYHVSDGHDLSTADLFRAVREVMGNSSPIFPVHLKLMQWLGRLSGRSAEISRLSESLQVNISSARLELGWEPTIGVSQSLSRTVDWFGNRDASI